MLAAIMILACLRWQLKCNKSKMSLEHLVALAVASNNSNNSNNSIHLNFAYNKLIHNIAKEISLPATAGYNAHALVVLSSGPYVSCCLELCTAVLSIGRGSISSLSLQLSGDLSTWNEHRVL